MQITVDGYRINYKITGSGDKNVVILQGWGTQLKVYDMVADCINKEYRVIQFDLPGFGDSEEPREGWGVSEFADFFLHFLKALDITKTSLIAHSYGGRIILKLAGRKDLPVTFEKIVMVDAAGIVWEKTAKQKAKIRRYKIAKKIMNTGIMQMLCPNLVEDWKKRQGSEDYRNATPIMRECLVKSVNEDLRDKLSLIEQDTLLIWGELDTATPLKDGQLMEKMIPRAGLVTVKGAGHYSFLEQPGLFRSVIRSYFEIKE